MNRHHSEQQEEVMGVGSDYEKRFAPPGRSLAEESEVMSPITKQAYTPEEVAKLLGLHANSVYQMLKNGELPGIKAGRKWLISKRRFHGWLDGGDQ